MTAANSTPLSDGASVVLLASEEWAKARNLPILAYITEAQTAAIDHVHKREGLLMAPAYAMPTMLDRAGITLQDFDIYEIHEAFAAQVLCTLAAWEDPVFCKERLGRDQAPRVHRHREAQHQRRLAGRRPPVRRDRRAHRRRPGEGAVRAWLGPRGHQHLRGRRSGRRRHARERRRSQVSQDLYTQIVNSPPGGFIAKRVGLPQPDDARPLRRRASPSSTARCSSAQRRAVGSRAPSPTTLADAQADVATTLAAELRSAAADAGLDASVFNPEAGGDRRFKGLVFDATGITDSTELVELQKFFHPSVRKVQSSGRVVVLGTPPEATKDPREHTAQRALEGFTRSLGKEIGKGATVQLVYVAPGAEDLIGSTLRFFLSPKSAYVSGQVARITPGEPVPADIDWERPLAGKVALVTGASRGIGEAIIETLARDGASVVGLDIPQLGEDLKTVTDRLDGEAIELDITSDDAPEGRSRRTSRRGVDIVVHNAGVTRDRTLAKMPEDRWQSVLDINLSSEERINDALLKGKRIPSGGRIIGVSSMAGIAGNRGQTNYATSKAGVIGMVESMAPIARRARHHDQRGRPGLHRDDR